MTRGPIVVAIMVVFALFAVFMIMMGASSDVMSGWQALAWIATAVAGIVALSKLNAGELVGKMTCPWITGIGGAGTGSIGVRRVGAQNARAVRVLLRMEVGVGAVKGSPCGPDEAGAVANMLDE